MCVLFLGVFQNFDFIKTILLQTLAHIINMCNLREPLKNPFCDHSGTCVYRHLDAELNRADVVPV